VDASFLKEENKGAWGAILRDSNGEVIFSAWGTIPWCQNAETAEAIAVLEGVKSALPIAEKPVIVESDNAAVVKDLQSLVDGKSETSMIISEAKCLLDSLPGYRVEKVLRDCNITAHDIAKLCFREWCEGVLLESVPPCVDGNTLKVCKGVCNKNLDR
jgi:ribonuclease HI